MKLQRSVNENLQILTENLSNFVDTRLRVLFNRDMDELETSRCFIGIMSATFSR